MIGPAAFTTLRIYSLSAKNRILGGVALVLSMTPILINATAAYQRLPINLPAPLNCENGNTGSAGFNIGWVFFLRSYSSCIVLTRRYGRLSIASRGSLILVDSLAVAVTWCQTRAAIQLRTGTLKRLSLEQVMWENGAIYFWSAANLFNTAARPLTSPSVLEQTKDRPTLWRSLTRTAISLAASLLPLLTRTAEHVNSITSILNGRFLLALHETNARLEGAVGASISSLSLGTVSGDDPGAGPSMLPQFLGPIGGPVHSFDDDSDDDNLDDDVESVDFAQPSQARSQSPEFEVGE
ncbi:uncharacterized protein TRAVEDRAFT_49605 [Trametes versicolor FP-101664 SS1]|uniref:uncharacterized protein n=1 Tax=Trametes versicolor (strain FP-101664) TaxID=717944 RepID=UPI0004624750|nr:uncharacterized protein TRAVEDRAFT_49605 [Trametes versicolor FP-101664 SS1]EIW56785.1 hypothetical protein TRAVEDRAFT_49605 [Trametes versicolor FP-101664 SS1]